MINYDHYERIMTILLLETLRLSGSLTRHDGVTRQCYSSQLEPKLIMTEIRNCEKCDSRKKQKLKNQG
jgi:hypothetical protein